MAKKKSYGGKQMPKGEARPLGTPRPKKAKVTPVKAISGDGALLSDADRAELEGRSTQQESSAEPQKEVDTATEAVVESPQMKNDAPIPAQTSVEHNMKTLSLKGLSKNSKVAFYTGAATVLRVSTANFTDKIPPTTLSVDEAFLPAKQPKVKLTKEERAAARAAAPKPTEAERIAKAEAALAKRKAKLAATGATL